MNGAYSLPFDDVTGTMAVISTTKSGVSLIIKNRMMRQCASSSVGAYSLQFDDVTGATTSYCFDNNVHFKAYGNALLY